MKINIKIVNILIFLFILIVLGTNNIIFGSDASYDYVFNNVYNGYFIATNRMSMDLFPCGVESYSNPYFNILLFQVRLFLDSIPSLVLFIYAIPHAILCFFVYLVNKELFINCTDKKFYNWVLIFSATILSLSEVTFVSSVGTTFNIIPASVCVVAALYLLIKHFKNEQKGYLKWVGLLLGVAIGMELIASIYFITIILAFLICSLNQNLKQVFKNTGIIFLFATVSFLLYDGHWAYKLVKYFGNPIFPYFNSIFKSPFVSFVNYHSQYVMTNPLKLLVFPLVWFDNVPPNLQVEMMPFFDLRHIFMYFSTLILCFVVGRKIFISKIMHKVEKLSIEYKIQLFLLIFVVTSYIIWAQTYCLIRNLIPVLMLCGSFIVLVFTQSKKLLENKYFYVFLICFLFLININYKSINWGHSSVFVYSDKLNIKNNSVVYIVGKIPTSILIWQDYSVKFMNLFAYSDDNMPDFIVSENYLKLVDYRSKDAKYKYVIRPKENVSQKQLKNNGQYILKKYIVNPVNCKTIKTQYDNIYRKDIKDNPYDIYNRGDIKNYYDFPKYEICELK